MDAESEKRIYGILTAAVTFQFSRPEGWHLRGFCVTGHYGRDMKRPHLRPLEAVGSSRRRGSFSPFGIFFQQARETHDFIPAFWFWVPRGVKEGAHNA